MGLVVSKLPERTANQDVSTALLADRGRSEGRLYVDFDHTLIAANSTELFLRHIAPYGLSGAILGLLEVLKPWRLGPKVADHYVWRDPIRVWTAIILFPWCLIRWRAKATNLMKSYANYAVYQPLLEYPTQRLCVVSHGFQVLIAPLLAGTPLAGAQIVAHRLSAPTRLRRQGKLAVLRELDLTPDRENDRVITDSEDDADLLAAVEHAYLVEPSDRPVAKGYLPFYYLARYKRSRRFLLNQTLLEELPIALLMTALFLPFTLTTWIGAALLFLSFMCVYEVGYAENDRVGVRTESEPKLGPDVEEAQLYPVEPGAWIWAIGLAVLALVTFNDATLRHIADNTLVPAVEHQSLLYMDVLATWAVMLVGMRAVFYAFNHAPIVLRVFFYLPLQVLKYGALVVLLGTQVIGWALFGAQVLRMWALYLVRRAGGDSERIASQSVRLVLFVGLAGGIAWAQSDITLLSEWPFWIILGWCVLRAVPEGIRKLTGEALHSGMRRD